MRRFPAWYFDSTFTAGIEAMLARVLAVGGLVHDAGCGSGQQTLALDRDGFDVVAAAVSSGALGSPEQWTSTTSLAGTSARRPSVRTAARFRDGVGLRRHRCGGPVPASLDGRRNRRRRSNRPWTHRRVRRRTPASDRAERRTFDRNPALARRRMRAESWGPLGPWLYLPCLTPDAARGVVSPAPWSVTVIIPGEVARYPIVLGRDRGT